MIILVVFPSIVKAQIVNIPDANFKAALINLGVDTNNDGEKQISETEAVTSIQIIQNEIYSVEGIQSFINLTQITISGTFITEIDLTQNINFKAPQSFYQYVLFPL